MGGEKIWGWHWWTALRHIGIIVTDKQGIHMEKLKREEDYCWHQAPKAEFSSSIASCYLLFSSEMLSVWYAISLKLFSSWLSGHEHDLHIRASVLSKCLWCFTENGARALHLYKMNFQGNLKYISHMDPNKQPNTTSANYYNSVCCSKKLTCSPWHYADRRKNIWLLILSKSLAFAIQNVNSYHQNGRALQKSNVCITMFHLPACHN